MKKAIIIQDVTVKDPHTGGDVIVSIFKDMESGGMFGIDESWLLEQEDNEIIIDSPFNYGSKLLLVEEDGNRPI